MARAAFISDLGAVLPLVFPQAPRDDRLADLDSRHGAADADGSVDELRLEVYAADGADQYLECGRLALHGTRHRALGDLHGPGPGPLLDVGAGYVSSEAYREENISVRGLRRLHAFKVTYLHRQQG